MFAGLISKEQPVSAWGDPDKIMAALAPYSLDKPRDVWASDRQLLLQVATRTGSSTAEIYRHIESGIAVAFWGRLDNRPDLIAQLNAEHKASDDELIALAWLKWGEYCPEKLIGDFAFTVASPKTGMVFLARDVMGVKPLYYRKDEHGVFFANSAAAFKPLRLGTLTRSQKWMAEYMLGLSFSHTETAYEEIKKLAGAHCLLTHADGRMRLRRYHQFVDDAPIEKKRDPKYLEAYRAAWQEAVACRIPSSGNIGTENSGGLDSGSITAELARQLGIEKNRLFSFSWCRFDLEPKLILETAIQYELKNNFICCSDPRFFYTDERMQRIININGFPIEHSMGSYHTPFYDECQIKKVADLFSGFGGDEFSTSHAVNYQNELLDSGQLKLLIKLLPGNYFYKYIRLLKHLIFNKLEIRAKKTMPYDFSFLNNNSPIRTDFLNKIGYKDISIFAVLNNDDSRKLNDAAIWHFNDTVISTRLECCTLMACSYGLDYVWPMLDKRLIQQWLSTPLIWKVGDNGQGRNLHKKATKDVCVDLINQFNGKDVGFARFNEKISNMGMHVAIEKMQKTLREIPLDLNEIINLVVYEDLILKKNKLREMNIGQIFSLTENVDAIGALSFWLNSQASQELES